MFDVVSAAIGLVMVGIAIFTLSTRVDAISGLIILSCIGAVSMIVWTYLIDKVAINSE